MNTRIVGTDVISARGCGYQLEGVVCGSEGVAWLGKVLSVTEGVA